ncbi:unnamed protein product [Lactuca saligna]|uniref:DUF4283 domain-containing protein n=1 Tax=Lactuca saligna TaxID=75948 RepID=A0AA36E4M0_LACSI|nr:unnamed protein product [Lactuca saligna]
MNNWIVEKRPWDRKFFPLDHLILVDVEGLPLCAWSKEAFRKIFVKWGSIVHLEDELGEDVYKNQICILSTFQEIISEVFKISIDGQVFLVRIKEAFGWTPSFAWDNNKFGSERISDHGNFQED